MLDLSYLPRSADVQIFNANSVTNFTSYAQWNKPRGKSMAYMCVIGPGGFGGNGFVGAVAAAGGGGGGGSAGIGVGIFPCVFLPDTLFIQVGYGLTGLNGPPTLIQTYPGLNVAGHLLMQGQNGAAGSNGTNAVGGAGGTLPGLPTIASTPLSGLGKITYLDGQVGTTGGFNTTAPTAITYPTTGIPFTGGAGGGGIQTAIGTAGANLTGVGFLPTINGGAAGTTGVDGGIGSNGLSYLAQIRNFIGGAGGGSGFPVATTSNGGNGGAGGIGCGGGGGGAAVTGKTAGVGARGGDGLCVIICW